MKVRIKENAQELIEPVYGWVQAMNKLLGKKVLFSREGNSGGYIVRLSPTSGEWIFPREALIIDDCPIYEEQIKEMEPMLWHLS